MRLSSKLIVAFIESVAALYVVLFLYTGITKTVNAAAFNNAMKFSPVIREYSNVISLFLPPFEIFVALALMIRATRFYGLIMASGLMLVFTIYVTYIMTSGRPRPCLCGGIIQQMNWMQHLLFNYTFLFIGVTALIFHSFKRFIMIEQDKPNT
jgi:hypothetical protein